jgi:predicted nucleic acid-binding protein
LIKNSKSLPRIIIDTSTLFSAIYNRKGNEAQLLELADQDRCEIIIFDYVIEEIEAVFQKKGMDIELVYDLLDNYHNITISSLEDITSEEILLAIDMINDPLDRPIFIFSYREITSHENSYLVSGDKGFFRKEPREKLNNKVLHTTEAIEIIHH